MDAEHDDPNKHVRKTATFTHKQLVGGTSIVAALVALGPVRDMFVTNDKAEVMRVQIQTLTSNQTEIKQIVASGHAEIASALNRGNDLIMRTIKESEERTVRAQEKLEKRLDKTEIKLDTLEASTLRGMKR